MKISIFFLILGLSCLFETSYGKNYSLKQLEAPQREYHARCMLTIAKQFEALKTAKESERATREACLVETLMNTVTILASDLGCGVTDIIEMLALPNGAGSLLLTGKVTDLLTLIKLEVLISRVVLVIEGVFAQVGVLLQTVVVSLTKTLQLPLNLLTCLSLHSTLGEINGLVSGVLGVTLSNVLGVVGGVLGSLGGIANIG